MMGLRNDEEKGGQLPFLYQSDVKGAKVLIDVSLKEFTNENENTISYPVARVVQVLKKAPVPF